MQGILTGLKLCKQHGLDKLIAVTDSLEAYHLIMQGGGTLHPLRQVTNDVRDLLFSDWDIDFHFEPRQAITCADHLSRTTHDIAETLTIHTSPPASCLPLMMADIQNMETDISTTT